MSPDRRFEGAAGRATYAGASLAVYFGQHLVMWAALAGAGRVSALPWWFWLNPFRALLLPRAFGTRAGADPAVLALGMIATLAADAALAWLAFRRATHVRRGAWLASLSIVPLLQLGVVAWLSFAPDLRGEPETTVGRAARFRARTAVLGVLTGVGMVVGVVALSALVFGRYGYVLFVISPFLIATVVGYLVNRSQRISLGRTLSAVFIAFALGGAALLGFAFEGVVCLVLATPLILIMGFVGGALGSAFADLGRRARAVTLSSIAVLPLLMAAEAVLPPRASFESVEFVDVSAPPAAVWNAVVHMGPIPDAPAAPFRWGLAYPLRGEILGEGVGSIRRGVFSTGVAYERVTEWRPRRVLSFVVLSDPPSLRELSPYGKVNAPHVNGYFKTLDARFTLTPLLNGRTRLTLTTRHELDLEPALYWTPVAEWAVHANKVRVLAHFRAQAEAAVTPTSAGLRTAV